MLHQYTYSVIVIHECNRLHLKPRMYLILCLPLHTHTHTQKHTHAHALRYSGQLPAATPDTHLALMTVSEISDCFEGKQTEHVLYQNYKDALINYCI